MKNTTVRQPPFGTSQVFSLGKLKINLVYMTLTFLCAMLMSNATIIDKIAPFGVAFVAATGSGYTLAALAGCIAGYALPTAVAGSMRYLAAALLVMGIKWAFDVFVRLLRGEYLLPIIAFISICATGLVVAAPNGFVIYDILLTIADAIICAGSTYFIGVTINLLKEYKSLKSNPSAMTGIAFSGSILLISLSSLQIGDFSVGRSLAVLCVLFAAQYFGQNGGAVAGITTGVALSLGSPSFAFLAAAYGFGGLLAGIFSTLSKLSCCVAFILANSVIVIMTGATLTQIATLYEVMAATLLFMMIPSSFTDRFLTRSTTVAVGEDVSSIKNYLVSKLRFASSTLKDVSVSVQSATKKMTTACDGNINQVYTKVANEVCRRCGLKMFCWESAYSDTMNAFNDLTYPLSKEGRIDAQHMPEFFRSRCTKLPNLIEAINRSYADYMIKQSANRRINEVRGLLTDQFEGMSQLLYELSDELTDIQSTDKRLAAQIKELLAQWHIEAQDICCITDRFGKLTVEFDCSIKQADTISLSRLGSKLETICGVALEQAGVIKLLDRAKVFYMQKANYTLEFGVCQLPHEGAKLCGDSFEYITDHKGYVHMVISDGMGNGAKAAVDGTMTTSLFARFIKAGFSFDCALKLINSVLMTKATDESLSTLDIGCLDLYTGKFQLLKAGAAPTFIKRGNKVIKAESCSLPLGILKNVAFETSEYKLNQGDLIVMVSDGVTLTGEDWVFAELNTCADLTPQQMAEHLAKVSKQRRIDGHDDDVTVLTALVQKGI